MQYTKICLAICGFVIIWGLAIIGLVALMDHLVRQYGADNGLLIMVGSVLAIILAIGLIADMVTRKKGE